MKQACRSFLASIQQLIAPLERWTDKEQTQEEVETFILDHMFLNLPSSPFTEEEKQRVARQIYEHIWQQCVGPQPIAA